jgi:hypothetical protein
MNREHVEELLYQTLETQKGGIHVYETALKCVVNDELKKEWGKYLEHWELIHEVADKAKGEQREALKAAYGQSRNKRTSTCTTRLAGAGSCARDAGGAPATGRRARSEDGRRRSAREDGQKTVVVAVPNVRDMTCYACALVSPARGSFSS